MAIHKKFNNQDSKISDLSIIDHSQLSGTNNYGAHPISAIRKLPEKLQSLKEVDESLQTQINTIQDNTATLQEQINNVETNAKQIRIEVDDAGDTVTFYNYENESSQFRTGNAPDNVTLEISNDELTLKQVFVNEDNLTGLGTQASPINLKNLPDQETIISDNNEIYATAIKDTEGTITTNDIRTFENNTNSSISTIQNNIESINTANQTQQNQINDLLTRTQGMGGYLNAHDFGSANPTQEELTEYAIQDIGTITTQAEIYNGTKVKNLFNNDIWVLTNTPDSSPAVFSWSNQGTDAIIADANNDGLHGLVTGSYDNLEGFIDLNGHITINGLEEELDTINTDISTVNTDITNIVNNTTKIANSNGGFAGGRNATLSSSNGNGGAIGLNATATSGGTIGFNSSTLDGGSVGYNAYSSNGGSVGYNTRTSTGFAGGYNAKAVDSSNNGIDAIQLGTGTNSNPKTLQVYDDNIYDANTHNLTVTGAITDGTNSITVANTPQLDTANTFTQTQTFDGTPHYNNSVVEFKNNGLLIGQINADYTNASRNLSIGCAYTGGTTDRSALTLFNGSGYGIWISGTVVAPHGSTAMDLGNNTAFKWRNLYLSGNLTDGTNSVTIANIAKVDQSNTFTQTQTFTAKIGSPTQTGIIINTEGTNGGFPDLITFKDSDGTLGRFICSNNSVQYLGNIIFGSKGNADLLRLEYPYVNPGSNGSISLGSSGKQWKDLYLSGNLTDGTNSITIAEIVNKGSGVGQTYPNSTGGEIFNSYEYNIASGNYSHAEGNQTTASGAYSHAEGAYTQTNGLCAHAEGNNTHASGTASHAGGNNTRAGYANQTAIGTFNDNKSTNLFEIGNGTSDSNRSNAFEVSIDGIAYAGGQQLITLSNVISYEALPEASSTSPSFVFDNNILYFKSQNNEINNYKVIPILNYSSIDELSQEGTNIDFWNINNNTDGIGLGFMPTTSGPTGPYQIITKDAIQSLNMDLTSGITNLFAINTDSIQITSNGSAGNNTLTISPNGVTLNNKNIALQKTNETITINSTSWANLSNNSPYNYSANITLTTTITDNTEVELINNQAVLFATYGFAIASISGQVATIYSIGQPNTNIELTFKVGE